MSYTVYQDQKQKYDVYFGDGVIEILPDKYEITEHEGIELAKQIAGINPLKELIERKTILLESIETLKHQIQLAEREISSINVHLGCLNLKENEVKVFPVDYLPF